MSTVVGVAIVGAYFGVNNLMHKNQSKQPAEDRVVVADESNYVVGKASYESGECSYKLLFMGDAMFARDIGRQIKAGDNPFKHVSNILEEHNARILNVETTIANPDVAKQAPGKLYTFNAPLESINTLKQAKISVSVLANNHTKDYGAAATSDMLAQFTKAGLQTVGAGNNVEEAFKPSITDVYQSESNAPTRCHVEPLKLGIVAINEIENAYTDPTANSAGSAYFDKNKISTAIKTARDNGADIVVVMPHWGVEYSLKQSPRQVEWGRFFIDSGADAVVGGHPHVVQPTETYNGKPIVYSMGNFIFDGMSGDALKGQMISLSISKKFNGSSKVLEIAPVKSINYTINSSGYPVPSSN